MTDRPLSERIEFYDINPHDPAFKAVSRALKARIGVALEKFYGIIRQNSHLSGFFTDTRHMDRPKALQGEHWQAVFRDGLDDRSAIARSRSVRSTPASALSPNGISVPIRQFCANW